MEGFVENIISSKTFDSCDFLVDGAEIHIGTIFQATESYIGDQPVTAQADTIFQANESYICDQPVTAQAESVVERVDHVEIPSVLGSPRALGLHAERVSDIFSLPASTVVENYLPESTVGATNDRSLVAPRVALLEGCNTYEKDVATLKQVMENVHLTTDSVIHGISLRKQGIFPSLEQSLSNEQQFTLYNDLEEELRNQNSFTNKYETDRLFESLSGSIHQMCQSKNICDVENQLSTIDGTSCVDSSNSVMDVNFTNQIENKIDFKEKDLHLSKAKKLGQYNSYIADKIEIVPKKQEDKTYLGESSKISREILETNLSHVGSTVSNTLQGIDNKNPLTYASVVAPPNVRDSPTAGFSKECAVIMERLMSTSLDTYIDAIWNTMKQRAITYIGQAPDDPLAVLAFVKTHDLADLLIREGIWIGRKWVKVSALPQRATKIVISGALPYISDQSIAQQLSHYGKLAYSQFRRIPAATRTPSHRGILSFRREAFILLYDEIQIPEKITVLEDGKTYDLEISTDGPKCFRCGLRGHLASYCKELKDVTKIQSQHSENAIVKLQNKNETFLNKVIDVPAKSVSLEIIEKDEGWIKVRTGKRKNTGTVFNNFLSERNAEGEKDMNKSNVSFGIENYSYITDFPPDLGKNRTVPDVPPASRIITDISDDLSDRQNDIRIKNNTNNNNISGRVESKESSFGALVKRSADIKKNLSFKNKERKEQIMDNQEICLTKEIRANVIQEKKKNYSSPKSKNKGKFPLCDTTLSIGLDQTMDFSQKENNDNPEPLTLIVHSSSQEKKDQTLENEKKNENQIQVNVNNSMKKGSLKEFIIETKQRDSTVIGTEKNVVSIDVFSSTNDIEMTDSNNTVALDARKQKGLMKVQDINIVEDQFSSQEVVEKIGDDIKKIRSEVEQPIKERSLVEQLILDSRSLRASKRKDLVNKYAKRIPNLKNVLEVMVKKGNDSICLKGTPSYKRTLLIIEDLVTMERNPKTRAESKQLNPNEQVIVQDDSKNEELDEGYWKKYPPDNKGEMIIDMNVRKDNVFLEKNVEIPMISREGFLNVEEILMSKDMKDQDSLINDKIENSDHIFDLQETKKSDDDDDDDTY